MARTDLTDLYNWTDHRVNPESSDFKNVMKWLADHGAPTPTVIEISLDPTGWIFPGSGAFPGSIIMLSFPGDELPHDAALVLNSPGVLLKELGLPGGDTNYTPPGVPVEEPPKPTTHVGSVTLGGGWYPQINAETDTSVDGQVVVGADGRTYKFRKGIVGGWYKAL